jgi:Flp pilus assembly protein TadD
VLRRAEVARLRGRREEALTALREYFESGGKCAEAYLSLGLLLVEIDEMPGAEDAFVRARDAQPRLPGVHLALGRLAAIRGAGDEALRELNLEARLDPENPEPLLEIGLVHERILGDSTSANQWFAQYVANGGDEKVVAMRRRAWNPGNPASPGAR